ncbi:hypothetical protein ACL02T_10745 [Pseudonocardia sp. RS010]|uniref:hypothetical protein n=1 Tax=Pseudonocardia sp. RS010 TaxID=3385979 RepID=UPI0039A38A69
MQLTAATADVEHLERRLGEEQKERAELARRTDVAEQRADPPDRGNQALSTQLDAAREDAARHRDVAAELRAQLATATATAEGLREQLAAERAHGQQRVDDANARAAVQLEDLCVRHERDLTELRAQVEAAAGTNSPSSPGRGHRRRTARGSDTGPDARTAARRRRPRWAGRAAPQLV